MRLQTCDRSWQLMSEDNATADGDTSTECPAYDVDFREHPEAYEIGSGEQGVFKIQPYKSELLPLWTISELEAAEESAAAIYDQFETYRAREAFVGMDMARKYLQMGWTRSLRYAKYPGGRKYDDEGSERDAQQWYDPEKHAISQVFKQYLDRVRDDETYQAARAAFKSDTESDETTQ